MIELEPKPVPQSAAWLRCPANHTPTIVFAAAVVKVTWMVTELLPQF